jgi:DNA processing protein
MRQTDEDLGAWIRLSLVPGLDSGKYRALLSAFGLPCEILRTPPARLERVVTPAMVKAIADPEWNMRVEQTLKWAQQDGHTILTLADEGYPRQLLEISDPPPLLYVIGNAGFLGKPSLAIVGSRSSTPQGRQNAGQFARTLSDAGLTIVSGLALGIDAAAHEGGLQGLASTVAVMGTGPDTIYPKSNRALADRIAGHGALITEYPIGMPALPANFPRRNRLIAGLSRGVLVVEAAVASGSLITARMALEQGREVFAIPGSIHSPVSRGCHALIKQGAKLVETAEDVLVELQIPMLPESETQKPQMSDKMNGLLRHMGYDPCDIDTLCARCGLTADAVSAMLLQLELEGRVGSLPGGFYQRLK